MHDSNQTDPPAEAGEDASGLFSTLLPPPPPPGLPSIPRALLIWLGILVIFGVGGVLLGEQELALLAAFSGVFVAARAADEDTNWRELYFVLGWVVPVLGFILSMAVGFAIWKSDLPGFTRAALFLMASCSAGVAVVSVATPAADFMVRVLFHEPQPGHLLRLSARCVALAFALAIPGWFASQQVIADLLNDPHPFMDNVGLGGGLVGYVLLAFAGGG